MPTGGDAYGIGVLVVVVGVMPHRGERESRSQSEAGQTDELRRRNEEVCEMLLCEAEQCLNWRRIRKNDSDLKYSGEPDAVNVARPVRRGAVGKVPEMATRRLPTLQQDPQAMLTEVLPVRVQWRCQVDCPLSRAGLATLARALSSDHIDTTGNI